MFTHPQLDPIAIHLGPFGIHWYGLMYLAGFMAFLTLGKWRAAEQTWRGWSVEMVDDALFYGALGVIFGGRLGYVLF
jgi:phosphatidylglycerol:prolipoprotein diacylglycerol transferase